MSVTPVKKRLFVGVVIAAALGVLVLGGWVMSSGIFGASADCLDTVTQIGEEIHVNDAGAVESSETFDRGSIFACTQPTMFVVLSGEEAQTNIEKDLTAAKFVEETPGEWLRAGAYVIVEETPEWLSLKGAYVIVEIQASQD